VIRQALISTVGVNPFISIVGVKRTISTVGVRLFLVVSALRHDCCGCIAAARR